MAVVMVGNLVAWLVVSMVELLVVESVASMA